MDTDNNYDDFLQNYFDTIDLIELESANLLNRFDTKYAISKNVLPELLQSLSDYYNILDISGNKYFKYKNMYFDTCDKDFYMDHHNGKQNRLKMRYREYVESEDLFFEIKKKDNKGITDKKRLPVHSSSNKIEIEQSHFIIENSNYKPECLCNTLDVSYNRLTLLHKTKPQKITIDLNICFSNNIQNVNTNGLVIVELKQKKLKKSLLDGVISKCNGRKVNISKYCLGSLLLNSNLKYNRFKENIMILEKVNNGKFVH